MLQQSWSHHPTGFAAHWDKNSNLAWAFDTWFLNLFPRKDAFVFNGGGYSTLSFIPTLGTMILGLLAGGVLRRTWTQHAKVVWLCAAGSVGLLVGWGLGELGLCPVVKRIWTPSWVLYSGGFCFLFLAAFPTFCSTCSARDYLGLPASGNRHEFDCRILHGSVARRLHRKQHQALPIWAIPPRNSGILGQPYVPLLNGAAILLVLWLLLYWMYRRKLFLRL